MHSDITQKNRFAGGLTCSSCKAGTYQTGSGQVSFIKVGLSVFCSRLQRDCFLQQTTKKDRCRVRYHLQIPDTDGLQARLPVSAAACARQGPTGPGQVSFALRCILFHNLTALSLPHPNRDILQLVCRHDNRPHACTCIRKHQQHPCAYAQARQYS